MKDASATAIYGARGANGVIIITTKRGFGVAPRSTYQRICGLSDQAEIPQSATGTRLRRTAAGDAATPDEMNKTYFSFDENLGTLSDTRRLHPPYLNQLARTSYFRDAPMTSHHVALNRRQQEYTLQQQYLLLQPAGNHRRIILRESEGTSHPRPAAHQESEMGSGSQLRQQHGHRFGTIPGRRTEHPVFPVSGTRLPPCEIPQQR